MINKKGVSEGLMAIWFFFILAIIGVSVIVVVWLLFGVHKDIRLSEAESLYNKLVISISDYGYLDENLLSDEYNIFLDSGLNSELFYQGGNLYFKIEIIKDNEVIKKILHGNSDFEVQCALNGRHFAACKYGEIKLNDKNNPGEYYTLKIITGSNQEGKKL